MEVIGILQQKLGERNGVSQRNGQPWRKAEFLLVIPGRFERHINLLVSDGQQQRIARFESLIGKTVNVSFDIDAHMFEGRWFNELNAWGIIEYVDSTTRQANIAAAQAAQKPAGEAAGTTAAPQAPQQQQQEGEKKDGLPF